jgi:cobalt-zinc-cadmium efflux system membrane fusion protein
MKMIRYFSILFPALLIACNQQVESENGQDVVATDSGKIILTQDQIKNAGLKYGQITKHLLSQDVHAQGKLVAPPNAEADVVTFCDGVINSILVKVGDFVKKGQPLARVTSPEFISKQQEFLSAKGNLELWEEDRSRQETLNRNNISSDKQYQQVKAKYLEAKSTFNALRIEMNILGVNLDELQDGIVSENLILKSPITGSVDNVMVNIGKYIQPGQALFKVVNRSRLYVEMMIFEKDITKIKKGQRVEFTLGNVSDRNFETHISSVSGFVKPEARVVKAIAEFNNDGNELLPGMFVSAKIHTSENYLEALPELAVIYDGEANYHIYYTMPSLLEEDQVVFYRAAVKRGFVEDGYAQVTLLDDIPEKAMIVTEGSYYLHSAQIQGED